MKRKLQHTANDNTTLMRVFSPNQNRAAGEAAYNVTQVEVVDLNVHFYSDVGNAVLLRFEDESMRGAGVAPGDLVSADTSVQVRNRDVAVVLINGEAFIRRVLFERGQAYVLSDDGSSVMRRILPDDRFDIIAVVTGIHKILR